jgi:hypothetical protein
MFKFSLTGKTLTKKEQKRKDRVGFIVFALPVLVFFAYGLYTVIK